MRERIKQFCTEKMNSKELSETMSQNSESNLNAGQGLSMDNNSILELVRNFNNSVSTGPLYACSCCDQLWYKHSVSPADCLRLAKPDICKYLQNKKVLTTLSGSVKPVIAT